MMESGEKVDEHEDVIQKHRQERKDLQSKIISMKKTVPKNDKKKKKEVLDAIEKLEEELNFKHKQELEALMSNSGSGDIKSEDTPVEETSASEIEVKLTRAQRRRNRKESEDKERNKRISEQEKVNRGGPRSVELSTIKEALQKEGLQIYNVAADGNCLYCSIQHQLDVTGRESYEINELRTFTADFMRENKDDFIPFMYNDSDEPVDEEQFNKYCHDVASTKLWGGQLELRALSNILKCPIKIIQASGPPTIQGEQFKGQPLVLTYHRHLYRLGEHYNSTTTSAIAESDENTDNS